ncbi:MAG TPA: GNAT family N-acetyltransferase [Candidatus Eisenbacteria bacterium]
MPAELRTPRLLLRPLRATDVELDYDAVMSSAAMLRAWSQSGWPADDFTLAENLEDLRRHEREHEAREAFTFMVLDREGKRCLGCVYLTPLPPEARALGEGATYPAKAAFWVRASEVAGDLDRHLVTALREWLAAEWRFDRIVFTISERDTRQTALLERAGLKLRSTLTLSDGRACSAFV